MKGKAINTAVLQQTLAMIPLLTIVFVMGAGVGWLAPMLHYLKESPETAFTSENCAWIAALHYLTKGMTSFITTFAIDRMGRNVFLITASFGCLLVWVIVYWSRNVYVHYGVRILFGLCTGFSDTASSIYVGENSSPELRGVFSGLYFAAFYFGELVEFFLATFLSYEWVAIVNGTMALIATLSTILLKEPAHYLIMKGNTTKAEQNFDLLRDMKNPRTKHEFEDVKQYVLEVQNRKFSWENFRSEEVCRSLRIVLLTNLISYLSGYAAINSFVTIALSGSKSTGLSSTQLTTVFGVILFLAVLLSSIFMDSFNRRTLYLFIYGMITIIHAATAALYYLSNVYQIPHFHWILFALLTSFMAIHGMFVFPVTAVIRGELLPQNVKAVGSSLGIMAGSLGGFLSAKIFLTISDAFGMYVNFVLFSCLCLFIVVYIYFDLPETRGKTLTDIQRELRGIDVEKTNA